MATKKAISKQKTSFQIAKQIIACQAKIKTVTIESQFYSLKNKLKNLEKQLIEAKSFEYLAM